MSRHRAVALPLPIWQDPQSDLRLSVADGRAEVEFDCWDAAGEEADFAGAIVFEGVWAARSIRSEFAPFDIRTHELHSYILRVEPSAWIEELAAAREAAYADWPRDAASQCAHYAVIGHGDYVEVIARTHRVEKRSIRPAIS